MGATFWMVISFIGALLLAISWAKVDLAKVREMELQERISSLEDSVENYKFQLKTLQKRITKYERSITWVKTPETDIRVLQSKVREQLSIDLVSDGVISFSNREIPREDKKAVEVIVTGTIKVLKP